MKHLQHSCCETFNANCDSHRSGRWAGQRGAVAGRAGPVGLDAHTQAVLGGGGGGGEAVPEPPVLYLHRDRGPSTHQLSLIEEGFLRCDVQAILAHLCVFLKSQNQKRLLMPEQTAYDRTDTQRQNSRTFDRHPYPGQLSR